MTIKVGQQVIIPWWRYNPFTEKWYRVRSLHGVIKKINGAYHAVKITNNSRYDILELYPNEFKVVER
jgi:ribosomal protein L32E